MQRLCHVSTIIQEVAELDCSPAGVTLWWAPAADYWATPKHRPRTSVPLQPLRLELGYLLVSINRVLGHTVLKRKGQNVHLSLCSNPTRVPGYSSQLCRWWPLEHTSKIGVGGSQQLLGGKAVRS